MPTGEQSHIRFNTKHYLSVVIPSHARAAGVDEVLGHLAAQELPRDQFEVLVVSNFSDPALDEMVAKRARETGLNLRCLVAGRLGVNVARNLGLESAAGEFVLFLDDDCFPVEPTYLSRLLKLHAEYPEHVALGGAYLSPPNLNPAGRHYNWICNQWLGAQFSGPIDTHRLIGGAVSYKLSLLRRLQLRFNETIQYGGAETEFHQRLLKDGHRLLYDPGLSVVHNPEMSNYDLVRKAYLQGYGKALRAPSAEPPRPESFWDDWLKSTFQFNLYRKSFARGRKRGERGLARAPQWQIFLLYISLSVVFGLQRDPRLRRFLLSAHHQMHVWYWRLYHVASEAYGLTRRSLGFFKGRIMRGYGLIMRGYGLCMRIYGHSTGYVHAKSIRTYWTLYPIFYHLRRNWSAPRTLLDGTRMPFTHPDLDIKGVPLWVAGVDGAWTDSQRQMHLEKFRRLGIHSVELDGADFPLAGAAAARGLGFHFLLKPFADFNPDRFPEGTQFIVSVATSELSGRLDQVVRWVKALPRPVSLLLKIDGLPPAAAVKKFLSEVRSAGNIENFSFQMPRPAMAVSTRGFEYFRWLHRFADQTKGFEIPWRPVYRFEEDQRYAPAAAPLAATTPEVSVIIPHHRDFANLTHVVRALAAQVPGTPSFEVVVVDNAVEEHLLTTDQVGELKTVGAGLDLRVLSLQSHSAGHYLSGNARNLGVVNSSGRSILFLDSDILVPDEFIRGVAERLRTADVLMAKRGMLCEDFDPQAQPVNAIEPRHTYREDDYWEGYKSAAQWTDLNEYWKYSCTYCLALTRENLLKAGPFDPQFMMYGFEDVDLGFRLFKRKLRFGFLEQKVFHLYPRKELHNYHHDNLKRLETLSRSALMFFLLRPEKMPFALCQNYFAPTFRNWIKQPFTRLRPVRAVESVRLNAP